MINVDGMLFPDVITSTTPGAHKLAVLNKKGEDLTKRLNIESIDITNGIGVIFVKRNNKYYRRPYNFGEVTLKLKL